MAKKKTTKKNIGKTTKKATKKVSKKVIKQTSKKASIKASKKVTKKSVKKTAIKNTKKVVSKTKGKTSKKASIAKKATDFKKKAIVDNEIKVKVAEEILNLTENYKIEHIFESIMELDFFKSNNDDCLERSCENPATTSGHCRYHYIKNWKLIKLKQSILEEGKMQGFIQELISKYPLKNIESILNDLSDEKSFYSALRELDIIDKNAPEDVFSDMEEDDSNMAYTAKSNKRPYGNSFEEE